jgi:putative PepSY-like beta-lactamase-inhibitor
MKSCTRKALIATVLATLTMATVSLADEEKISVKELPKAVLRAVKEKFPKAEIKGAAKEEEDGKTTYEVMLKVKGRSVDVAMKADGTILEIEKEMAVDDLPKAVRKTLSAKYPNAKITKAEAVTKGEDGPVRYEVAITTEVVLNAKGKIAGASAKEEEDDDDEKPKAEGKKSRKDDDKDDDEHENGKKTKKGEKQEKDDDD